MFHQVRSYNFNYYFIILTGGHNTNSTVKSLNTGLRLKVSTGAWTTITSMEVARREHACLFVEFEETKGILVTGGKLKKI